MDQFNQNITNINQEKELTLKDLLLKVSALLRYLLSQWRVIIAVAFLGAGIGLLASMYSKKVYVSELTFVLEDSKSSSLGAYSGLASQIGIDLSGGGSSGVFSNENIMGFLQSRLMVEKALLSPILFNGKTISLADCYLEINNFREKWKENPAFKSFSFPYDKPRTTFTRAQDSVLNDIFHRVLANDLTVEKADKKLSFISVQYRSSNEFFAKQFSQRLVQVATDFYVETKIKRAKINVDKLQEKADSIEALLNRKTYSTALAQDLNMNPARRSAMVGVELDNRDKMVLQTMYGEILKNLEVSKMTMDQETPLIQQVDGPILPLPIEKLGKTKGVITGGFLGTFLIIIFLTLRKIFKSIMNS